MENPVSNTESAVVSTAWTVFNHVADLAESLGVNLEMECHRYLEREECQEGVIEALFAVNDLLLNGRLTYKMVVENRTESYYEKAEFRIRQIDVCQKGDDPEHPEIYIRLSARKGLFSGMSANVDINHARRIVKESIIMYASSDDLRGTYNTTESITREAIEKDFYCIHLDTK